MKTNSAAILVEQVKTFCEGSFKKHEITENTSEYVNVLKYFPAAILV